MSFAGYVWETIESILLKQELDFVEVMQMSSNLIELMLAKLKREFV